jgi:hypothetical protein
MCLLDPLFERILNAALALLTKHGRDALTV